MGNRTKLISVSDIIIDDFCLINTKIYRAQLILLTESVRQYGQLENIVVSWKEKGRYLLISGRKRLEVIKNLGIQEVAIETVNVRGREGHYIRVLIERIKGLDSRASKLEKQRMINDLIGAVGINQAGELLGKPIEKIIKYLG